MKQNRMIKIAALVLCTLLAGCSTAPQPLPVEAAAESGIYQLVNDPTVPSADSAAFAPESPSIDDLTVLGDGQLDVQQTNLQFDNGEATSQKTEVKAVWISYLEMDTLLKNKTEAEFRKNIGEVFDDCKNYGLNTVVVHVRPFGDALYQSDYFPWSYIVTGTEGKDPGFDPLAIMVTEAKSRGLRIEAWVNPYRVRATYNTNALSADNQAKIWLDAGDSAVIKYGEIISYNPASEKARTLIVDGMREIVRKYDINAIHIDDYFYPTTDSAFDLSSYNAYKNAGGTMNQGDWRRNNVEILLQDIYKGVKEENPNVLFGISPQGNVDVNYNGQYLDVKKITSTTGYCDYICPQVYYGFQNEAQPFATVVKNWDNMIGDTEIDLYIGIAVYKLGTQDNWAGQGKNEWLNTSVQLKNMVETARVLSNYNGFVLYRYDSLFRPEPGVSSQVSKEAENLKGIL